MCTVSIITASYNYAQFIGDTIDSVLNQTFRDWELIIVDDGSKDNSCEIISAFCRKDRRIKLLTHPGHINRGLPETLKLGISQASGQYIAFLESDDLWYPENLARKIAVLEKFPNVALVDDDVELFGETSLFSRYDRYWQLRQKLLKKYSFPANIFSALLYENLIPTFSCAVCRADVLKTCNFGYGYAPHLDRSLWMQICKNHQFYHLSEKLTRWRIHPVSYISREKQAYRRNFPAKAASLIMSCYNRNPLDPRYWFTLCRFIAVNILRGICNRLRIEK